MTLSGIVITFNEEKKIARCLDSMSGLVDEIVVVDSFSTDLTEHICRERKVRFFQRKFTNHIDQKNFAIGLATADYVLYLDADEYLSSDLRSSIGNIKEIGLKDAYSMDRISSYGGEWIRHGSWFPDTKIRIWNKRSGSFGGYNPHDHVLLKKDVQVKKLKGLLMHESYANSLEGLKKIVSYSEIYSDEQVFKRSISRFGIFTHSVFAFFKSYILKLGILDGFNGWVVAIFCFNHTFFKYARLHEKNRNRK
ncbi:MAG: glycosyltransferase family 2 protein [Bacteroidetes bacterium]|nr:glycosyltransferase family 2 protein [Bacteroidota bacterium]